jgi:hypothetical protein
MVSGSASVRVGPPQREKDVRPAKAACPDGVCGFGDLDFLGNKSCTFEIVFPLQFQEGWRSRSGGQSIKGLHLITWRFFLVASVRILSEKLCGFFSLKKSLFQPKSELFQLTDVIASDGF